MREKRPISTSEHIETYIDDHYEPLVPLVGPNLKLFEAIFYRQLGTPPSANKIQLHSIKDRKGEMHFLMVGRH